MPLHKDILKNIKGDCKIFIETGTYIGSGVQTAFEEGFEQIYSVEYNNAFYERCVKRFINYKNVNLYKGDSSIVLKQILKTVNKQSVIFLDAHYCGDNVTGLSGIWIPIKEELEVIKNDKINNHVIIIDDMMAMDNSHFDLKSKKWVGAPGIDVVLDMLIDINPNYKITALLDKDQIIAVPCESNNSENDKDNILKRLYNKRLPEHIRIIQSLCKKLDNLNISYTDVNLNIDVDLNNKGLKVLRNLKIELSKKIASYNF